MCSQPHGVWLGATTSGSGVGVGDLAAQCRAFLDSTERLYEESMDRALREHVGIGLGEAERWDVRLVSNPLGHPAPGVTSVLPNACSR